MAITSFKQSRLSGLTKFNSFLANNNFVSPFSYELLETQRLASDVASVEFTGLGTYAETYDHLQIRAVVRSARANDIDGFKLQLNGDTGSNYSRHKLTGNSSSVVTDGFANLSSMDCGASYANDENANKYSPFIIDLLDAFSTSKNTTMRGISGVQAITNSARKIVALNTGAHFDTSAVSSLKFFTDSASNLKSGTVISIYGIRKD